MKEQIRSRIALFVERYARESRPATGWRTPLVGFASAGDPLFTGLKTVVSPSHALPTDLLADARSVVAFFLPFERGVVTGNVSGEAASTEWARAYIETNALIRELGLHMKGYLESLGHAAAATPATHNFDPAVLLSDWSHRHIAHIAGLGTFGLNNMLITESGCCGRLGSFVTSAALAADPRPTAERCLHKNGSRCARCVSRCVGGALRTDGFDRHACWAACLRNERLLAEEGKTDVCGKCLVGVPCSFVDPTGSGRKG